MSVRISCDEHLLIAAHDARLLIKLHCCSITRHFYSVSSRGMRCQFCGKHFRQGYTGTTGILSTDYVSTTSTEEFGSSTTTDAGTEEEMDPWIPIIEEAKHISNTAFEEIQESLINNGFDEDFAKEKACSNIMPKLQKEWSAFCG